MNSLVVSRRNILILSFTLAAVVLVIAPFIGMKGISPRALFFPSSIDGTVLYRMRIPRVLTAFLSGAGLAVSGMVFQAMFKNPLATPFTLGVSAGAGFGASIFIRFFPAFVILGIPGVSLASFCGAMLSMVLVYFVAKMRRGFSNSTLLLSGVAINFLFSSFIMFVQYLSDHAESFRMVHWLMGSLSGDNSSLLFLSAVVFLISAGIFLFSRELNLFSLGDEIAQARGVDTSMLRKLLFFLVTFLVGSVVSVCGPVGFVGMMIPHIMRLLVGPDHRTLLPATLCGGGLFLTLCDTMGRVIIPPAELPVGIITSLFGAPFFIFLLVGRRGRLFS